MISIRLNKKLLHEIDLPSRNICKTSNHVINTRISSFIMVHFLDIGCGDGKVTFAMPIDYSMGM